MNRPEVRSPKLEFRYYVEFPEFDNCKFTTFCANTIDLPKWTIENGWKNPIDFHLYNFELADAIETILIDITQNPLNNKIKINLLNPMGEITGCWDIVGHIEVFDFGKLSWKSDDPNTITLKILPIDCQYTNFITQQDNNV